VKTDALFLDSLVDGHIRSVWAAAEIVRRYPTCFVRCHIDIHPPQSIHRGEFSDEGDLLVNGRHVIEVKGRPRLDLRAFRYPSVFLGETYKLDPTKVHGVVVVGRDRYPMWYFACADREQWGQERVASGPDGRDALSWAAPTGLAQVWERD